MYVAGYESDDDGKRFFRISKAPRNWEYDREGMLYEYIRLDNSPKMEDEIKASFSAGKYEAGELSYHDRFGKVKYFFVKKEDLKKTGYSKKKILSYVKFAAKISGFAMSTEDNVVFLFTDPLNNENFSVLKEEDDTWFEFAENAKSTATSRSMDVAKTNPAFYRNLMRFAGYLSDIGNVEDGQMYLLKEGRIPSGNALYIVHSVYHKDSGEHLLWGRSKTVDLSLISEKELDDILIESCKEKTPVKDPAKYTGIFHRGGVYGQCVTFGRREDIWQTSLATEYDLKKVCIPVFNGIL